jgi:hypothetical protein
MKIAVLLLFTSLFLFHAGYSQENYSNLPKLSNPAWFVNDDAHDLSLLSNSKIVYKNIFLKTDTLLDEIAASAYYPDENQLIIVTSDACAYLFKQEKSTFNKKKSYKPAFAERFISVHFTRNPGLLYIFSSDLKTEEEISKKPYLQIYAEKVGKVDFYENMANCDGIPIANVKETVLTGFYLVNGKEIKLNADLVNWITIKLASDLSSPFREGPGDRLPEAVFLFKDKGLICRTIDGWSLHKPDGSLIKNFFLGKIEYDWWQNPVFERDDYYVIARIGFQKYRYKLNVKKGILEPDSDKN